MYYRVWTLGRLLETVAGRSSGRFTLGMGVDRFIVPRHVSEALWLRTSVDAAARQNETPLRRAKHLIRDTFLGMGLGENLGVVARL